MTPRGSISLTDPDSNGFLPEEGLVASGPSGKLGPGAEVAFQALAELSPPLPRRIRIPHEPRIEQAAGETRLVCTWGCHRHSRGHRECSPVIPLVSAYPAVVAACSHEGRSPWQQVRFREVPAFSLLSRITVRDAGSGPTGRYCHTARTVARKKRKNVRKRSKKPPSQNGTMARAPPRPHRSGFPAEFVSWWHDSRISRSIEQGRRLGPRGARRTGWLAMKTCLAVSFPVDCRIGIRRIGRAGPRCAGLR